MQHNASCLQCTLLQTCAYVTALMDIAAQQTNVTQNTRQINRSVTAPPHVLDNEKSATAVTKRKLRVPHGLHAHAHAAGYQSSSTPKRKWAAGGTNKKMGVCSQDESPSKGEKNRG